MTETESKVSRWKGLHLDAVGGVAGGLLGALFAAGTTQIIKSILAVVTRQDRWVLMVLPLVGVTVAVLLLQFVGHGEGVQRVDDSEAPRRIFGRWRLFPNDVARADLTADVVTNAGEEDGSRGGWHLFARSPSSPPSALAHRWAPRRPPHILVSQPARRPALVAAGGVGWHDQLPSVVAPLVWPR